MTKTLATYAAAAVTAYAAGWYILTPLAKLAVMAVPLSWLV